MGQLIFSDTSLLEKTNQILHPAVKAYIKNAIAAAEKENVPVFVIEAALLIEDDYGAICDELWYIYTRESVRRERLKSSRGYTDEYITNIMKKQLSDETFRSACDFVIDNSESPAFTKEQIDKRMK